MLSIKRRVYEAEEEKDRTREGGGKKDIIRIIEEESNMRKDKILCVCVCVCVCRRSMFSHSFTETFWRSPRLDASIREGMRKSSERVQSLERR